MKRILVLGYGLASYCIFFAVFLYAIGFIGNFGVPTSLDADPTKPTLVALAINAALLLAFAVQHSGMARQSFKRWLSQYIPQAAERSTYVLMSSLAMIALFVLWEPMGGTIWDVSSEAGRTGILTLYLFGWSIVFVSTCLIDHFELFGLSQVWACFRGKPHKAPEFKTPSLYRVVRHPIYTGWAIVAWAAPTMTVAHLFFAIGMTAYILVGIRFEEKDLVDFHGEEYESYRERVPALVPGMRPRARKVDAEQETVHVRVPSA